MAIKTVIFVLFYMTSLGGSIFFHPMVGVVGYVMTYVVAPSSQWWASPLVDMGMRFSFFMAAAMVLGMIMQSQKLRLPGRLYRQEILFFIFIIWIFLSSYIGLNNYGNDNFAIKLFKVSVFLWMLVRIVDNQKNMRFFYGP